MLCRRPFTQNGKAFGCGQCDPCRTNRRRIWSHRVMLEAKLQADNTMITLTYDDEHLPRLPDGRGNLVPKHLQDWLKRFRSSISPLQIRFYGCGEYGDESWRPHFHVVVFGYPNCRYGKSRYIDFKVKSCCDACDLVRDTWRHGGVLLIELNDHTAQYTAGYVTKKMTDAGHPMLKGLHPEFARMSKGVGKMAMWDVASTLLQFNLVKEHDDVPSSLQHGTRKLPLGRYLRGQLRTMIGRDVKAPESTLKAIEAELLPLRQQAFDNSRSFAQEIIKEGDQAYLNQQARKKIHRQRKDKL